MQVDLDDMEGHVGKDERLSFSHPCRCGQAFVCAESDLSETADSLLVQCQGCSLIMRVLYTVDGSADQRGPVQSASLRPETDVS